MTDVIHNLHSKIFNVANVYTTTTWKCEPEFTSVWLQHNLYLGYSILLVSHFAILYAIFRELCKFGISKNKTIFLEEFYTSYGMIWSLSLLLSLNIILRGTDCDYFM